MSTDDAPNPQLGTRSSLPAGDRRTVTVLFVDLVGFTAMSERLDPEEVTAILGDYFAELVDEVRAHDG